MRFEKTLAMTETYEAAEFRPANDSAPPEELDAAISEVLTRARFAWAWCVENDFEEKAAPLRAALNQTQGYLIRSSAEIGESGFTIDEKSRTIFFSAQGIGATLLLASLIAPHETSKPVAQRAIAMSIVTLYIFHELTHISQLFIHHHQAQTIKNALGKQFLAVIDTRTDIKSAHCASIISCAYDNNISRTSYVTHLLNNAILAFRTLVDAFSISGAEHKQQRALGLLCTIAICESAIQCESDNVRTILSAAASPVFAGYDSETKRIICINLDTSEIVFTSNVSNNYTSAEQIWCELESTELSSAIQFLRSSYEDDLAARIIRVLETDDQTSHHTE